MYKEVQAHFLQAILETDRDKANEIIDQWAKQAGYEDTLIHILEPVLEELGNMWTVQQDVSFAQVYVSATIAEDIILKVFKNREATEVHESKGTIILGNIEDDFHALGRRLVGIFLTSSGWHVIDLGVDVTAEEFVDRAVLEGAHIIGASAMMYTTAINIKKIRQEIDKRGLTGKLMLAVGGAVFNLRPDLWQVVGADGTSRNAIDVGGLMETLLERVNGGGSQ